VPIAAMPSSLVADASQDAVLAVPDGVHAAVLGAPGTGKTTTLARLVADRLHRPDAIAPGGFGTVVALTSSRPAATALRDRLAAAVGTVTPGALARTVNSLAFQIVSHAAALAGDEPPTLLTGGEQDSIIADLLAGDIADGSGPDWPPHLGPDVRERSGFRTVLRDCMMRATAAGIEPDRMQALGRAFDRPEWTAVGAFVTEYRQAVSFFRDTSRDASDLVAYATAAVDRGELPSAVAALRLVVVDDAQELVEGEIGLLGALARAGVQVVVFGDPDIAASAFRGGEPDVLGRFASRLGVVSAERIVLGTVHRHGEAIRALVSSITARIGTAAAGMQRQAVALSPNDSVLAADDAVPAADGAPWAAGGAVPPAAGGIAPVVHVEASSHAALVAAVARRLREHHLHRGVPWHRMVVVTRSGAAIGDLVRTLSVSEVPATAGAAPARTRDDLAARALVDAAAVALGILPLDAEVAARFLAGPLGGLDALALRRLRLALRREEFAGGGHRSSDELLVEALEAPGRLATIDAGFARRAARFASSLAAARTDADAGASVEELLWGLWERSGLARMWGEQSASGGVGAAEADRHLDAVVGLFTAAKRFVEREPDALARVFVDDVLESDLPEDSIGPDRTAGRVRVLTPSATVGVECDVVVVLGLQDGVWPNTRLRGTLLDPDGLVRAARGIESSPVDERAAVVADELRLLARAVSRARVQVVVGAIANDDESPSPFVRLVTEPPVRVTQRHPLSLRGMAGSLRRRVATTGDPQAVAALARLARAGVPGADPDDWYGIREPSTDAPLVDLDGPDAPTVHVSPSQIEAFEECPLHWFARMFGGGGSSNAMGIGTIVHDAMEHATAIDVESLWQTVDARWAELTFESDWLADLERRRARTMIEGLSDYLRQFAAAGRRVLGAESRFQLVSGPAEVHGSIDRIEIDPSGRISVVDLKTGRYAAAIKDMPRNAQLGAYQLAVDDGAVEGLPDGATVADARLLFVQLPSRGDGFTERVQSGFDATEAEAFRARLREVATGMAGRTFEARVDEHCEAARTGVECRIHIVGEVTW
jgi:superfamily I DNA/RNA helicase/RecB family exonuclease